MKTKKDSGCARTKGKNENLAVICNDTPECRIFDLSRSGLPEIPEIGSRHHKHVRTPILPHRHTGCMEIGLCLRGALTLMNQGVEYPVMPGDIYLNKPDETHCLTTRPRDASINWLLLRVPLKGRPFLRLTYPQTRDLWQRLMSLPCHITTRTNAVKQAFADLFKYQAQPPGHYRTVCLTAACISLLIGVIEAAAHKSVIAHIPLVEKLVDMIRKEPERNVHLDDLVRAARISPSLLNEQFKQITGQPPIHFQLACRLEKAKRLLAETDTPITQLALDLGFCSSQHFSGHFKRTFGLTPSAWRKQQPGLGLD
jgi:AraC-like DNA-binding protein